MLNIKCPYCGDRSQKEFAYGGDGTITRPKLNQEISDEEWDNFIYLLDNLMIKNHHLHPNHFHLLMHYHHR